MSARMHRALLVLLASVAILGPGIAFAVASPAFFKWFDATVGGYLIAQVIALAVLPIAIPIGLMFLVYGLMNAFVPARCPKCGGRAYRYGERGPWLTLFAGGSRVIYWCSSCGNREDLGYSDEG